MKKLLLLAAVCVLGLFGSLRAQETITIGSGTDNAYRTPVNTNYSYCVSQQIYTASEIGKESGKIAKIAFRWASSTAETRNWAIYLKNTNQSSFGNWVSVTDSDKVFDGEVNINTEWVEITFTTKFEYTGGNLLLCVYDHTGNWGAQSYFYNYATEATAISVPGTTSPYDPANMSGGTVRNYNNQIKLTFAAEGEEEVKPNAPENLSATALNDTQIKLTWDAVENAAIYTVYQDNVEIKTALQATTYTVENLNPGTNYCFTVTASKDLESEKSEEACVSTESRATTFAFDFNNGIVDMHVSQGANASSTYNWASPKDFPFADMVEGVKDYYRGVDGTMAVYSLTYNAFKDEIYTPDNYIVTNKPYLITETSTLEWDIRQAEDGKTDQYSIVVSENGTNFVDVWFERYSDKTGETKAYSLADYAGKEIYIGFHHYKKTDGGALCLDNVKLVLDSQITPEAPVDMTAPAIPDNVKAVAFSESTIKLTWNAAENATSYKIYKGEDIVATSVTETSYMVENLEANTQYCFTVTAVNGNKESAKSSEVCATTLKPAVTSLLPPTNLKAKYVAEEMKIELTWNKVENAKLYQVYMDNTLLEEHYSDAECTITNGIYAGEKYCFEVIAINGNVVSPKSQKVCVTASADGDGGDEGGEEPSGKLAAPQNFKVEALVPGQLALTWDPVEGAKEYNIYEGDEVIGTVKVTGVDMTGLDSEKEYCFTVTAVNDDSNSESEKSEEECATVLANTEEPGEGIEEFASSFNVYPNPVNDVLFIETEVEINEVVVYTITGVIAGQQSTVNSQQLTIDVANLNSGVYFVKVVTENGEVVKRFVKK